MLGTFLCAIVALAAAQESQTAAREELAQYYQSSKIPAAWDVSMKQLASTKAEDRRNAVKHLVELMEQSYQDEKSGKAPWHATPYWDSPRENPARRLREAVVYTLGKSPAQPELLPIVRWLLSNEPKLNLQEQAARFLGKIDGKEAEDFREKVVLEPHPNAVVMGLLLGQIDERKGSLPAERLKELCQHHRKDIRDPARKLNQALHGLDPGPFDSVGALASPAIRKTLDELRALMIDLPAKDAQFVEVTIQYLVDGAVKQTDKDHGWLLKQDQGAVELFSPHGSRHTYRDKDQQRITVPVEGKERAWTYVNAVTSISVAKADLNSYVKEVIAIRAKGNEEYALSAGGPLTGQFQGRGASLMEAILAVWLDRAGEQQQCAAVLLPALDTLYEYQVIVDMARQQLGIILGHRMLVAFVGDRDYPETLKLAETLVKNYPRTKFHEYAEGLIKQLPLRMDDFKTLRLPTPQQWTEMKQQMSRRQQIEFLCERLRLLNCFQWGRGNSPGVTQYAEPCGLSDNAAWGLGRGKTELINPYSELTGHRGIFLHDDDKEHGLHLKAADIPILVPYLREDWYQLCVEFWRYFVPERSLTSTRPCVARLINEVARFDLCKLQILGNMSPEEREVQLHKIIAWAEAHQGKSEEEILLAAIQDAMANNTSWRDVSQRIDELVKMKSPKALPIIEKYLREPGNHALLPEMLRCVPTLSKTRAVELAKEFLTDEDEPLRMQSALILLDAGEVQLALPVLAELLENGSPEGVGRLAPEVIDSLLKLGTEPAKETARAVLRNKHLREPQGHRARELSRHMIIPRLEYGGYSEAWKVYLELLDAQGNQYGDRTYGVSLAEIAVEEILRDYDYGDVDSELKKAESIKDFAQRRAAVRRWVEGKIKGSNSK